MFSAKSCLTVSTVVIVVMVLHIPLYGRKWLPKDRLKLKQDGRKPTRLGVELSGAEIALLDATWCEKRWHNVTSKLPA
jgi:hypothetical protein